MVRANLKCSHCGENDFVIEQTIVPRGVNICCNSCGCCTPIAVTSNNREVLYINGKASLELYGKSYCRDISWDELKEADSKDSDQGGVR